MSAHTIPFYELALRRALSKLGRTRFERFMQLRAAIGDRALGLDVSYYDGYFDPQKSTHTIDFVIQRLCYGTTPDARLDVLWNGVQQIAIRLGYLYLVSFKPWQDQVDAFLNTAAKHSYHAFRVDFEGTGNSMTPAFAEDCYDACLAIQTQSGGKWVASYANISTYDGILFKYAPQINVFDFWLAWWPYVMPDPLTATPRLPLSPADWAGGWQYSANGNNLGAAFGVLARDVDLDVMPLNVAQLRVRCGLDEEPEPLPDFQTQLDALSGRVDKIEHIIYG